VLPEWNFAVFLKPEVLLRVPEPNSFAASQIPEVRVWVQERNSFEVPQKPEEQEQVPGPGRNNFAGLRKPAGRAPEQNSFSALRKLAAQVRAPEPNSFAAREPGLTEPAENKMAEKGQGKESAPARKPADD
jgi:hypothetical protein